jgi:hypothetical protein
VSDPFIITASGRRFYPLNPRVEDVHIEDIAYVLAGEWRFGGHCNPRISVAQHSVMVSERLEETSGDALAGLLHDASEAYMRDLNRPIKVKMADYGRYEAAIMAVIAERFGFKWPLPESVHEADRRMLATEADACMDTTDPEFYTSCPSVPRRYNLVIEPWGMDRAEREFLDRFNQLTGGPVTLKFPAHLVTAKRWDWADLNAVKGNK